MTFPLPSSFAGSQRPTRVPVRVPALVPVLVASTITALPMKLAGGTGGPLPIIAVIEPCWRSGRLP